MKLRDFAVSSRSEPSGPTGPKDLAYRPDIDGLRAVAVLAVLLYHYDVWPFSGGFVGVDVFFVISGYLITAILSAELAGGRPSLLAFYERRLRRIAPALFALLVLCGAISLFVFLPEDLRTIGDGILNAALGKSNIMFYAVAENYFEAGTLDYQPVLHTWSLSVEAQFYLIYPALLLIVRWRSWPIRPALLAVAAVSFAGSVWGTTEAPVAAFYLLPARVWEFLAGGLASCAPRRDSPNLWRAPGLSWLGLGLIAAGAVAFTRTTPFPGLAALPPVLGAVLVLRAGAPDVDRPNAMLRLPPLRFIGRISYSLYLWHWPLLVFFAYRSIRPLDLPTRLGVLALSFGVAVLSYGAVEQPFLRRRFGGRRTGPTLAMAVVAALLVVQSGILLKQVSRGAIPVMALPPDVAALAGAANDMLREDCAPAAAPGEPAFPCRFGADGRTPAVALWGNSFARMWAPALDIAARADGTSGLSYLLSYCLPFIEAGSWQTRACADFNASAFAAIRARPDLTTVVLGGNWSAAAAHIDALGPTVAALKALGRHVVVILSPPQLRFSVPHALALAALRHGAPPPPVDEADVEAAQAPTDAAIERLRLRYGFGVVDPADWLCDGNRCDIVRNGVLLYFDANHISVSGARMAAGLFARVLGPAVP